MVQPASSDFWKAPLDEHLVLLPKVSILERVHCIFNLIVKSFHHAFYDKMNQVKKSIQIANLYLFSCQVLFQFIESFSIDDGDGSENITFEMNERFLKLFSFIPIC